jgi:hypothetical protein
MIDGLFDRVRQQDSCMPHHHPLVDFRKIPGWDWSGFYRLKYAVASAGHNFSIQDHAKDRGADFSSSSLPSASRSVRVRSAWATSSTRSTLEANTRASA